MRDGVLDRALRRRTVFLLIAACSGCVDEAGSEPAPASNLDTIESTATITPASGGTVSLPTGATLVVPGGAVASDTEVTLRTVDTSYDWGNDGTLAVVEALPNG